MRERERSLPLSQPQEAGKGKPLLKSRQGKNRRVDQVVARSQHWHPSPPKNTSPHYIVPYFYICASYMHQRLWVVLSWYMFHQLFPLAFFLWKHHLCEYFISHSTFILAAFYELSGFTVYGHIPRKDTKTECLNEKCGTMSTTTTITTAILFMDFFSNSAFITHKLEKFLRNVWGNYFSGEIQGKKNRSIFYPFFPPTNLTLCSLQRVLFLKKV